MQHYIRRKAQDRPREVEDEASRSAKYPSRAELVVKGKVVELIWRSERWQVAAIESPIRCRNTYCWLLDGDIRVGALIFRAWKVAEPLDNAEFYEWMDADSSVAEELGFVVTKFWDIEDLLHVGPLLEYRIAWLSPSHARGGLWAAATQHLLGKLSRRKSLLILKAFPIEYSGHREDHPEAELGLLKRQAAMRRHYTRHIGCTSVPGTLGDSGWMWRALSPTVPPPADSGDQGERG